MYTYTVLNLLIWFVVYSHCIHIILSTVEPPSTIMYFSLRQANWPSTIIIISNHLALSSAQLLLVKFISGENDCSMILFDMQLYDWKIDNQSHCMNKLSDLLSSVQCSLAKFHNKSCPAASPGLLILLSMPL